MNWLANATESDAAIILRVWPDMKINKPVPKELKMEGLVGIYGNYSNVGKRTTESDE